MPIIYLSPSTQEGNLYVTGNSEEYYMNKLADAMVPFLRASGIQFSRNTPEMTAASSIRASNRGNYDLHLALHSNAAPEDKYGTVRGIIVFYYPGSSRGQRASELVAENLRAIYPLPNLVRTEATTRLGEVRQPKAPSVFLELGYHDNLEDALWVQQNIPAIAEQIVIALTEYFGIPFLYPTAVRTGRVRTSSGRLNIRNRPTVNSAVKGSIPNGASVTVYGQTGSWYVVEYGGVAGYANSSFITL